jgi:predicted DNA-binding protein YlxM (UPF0122 family)
MYIPSKYTFEMKTPEDANGTPMYIIRYINIAQEVDKETEAGIYGGVKIELPPDGDMAEHLEGHYKDGVALKDIAKEDTPVLKTIYRQMRRLRHCVQDIKYKLGISYKNYLCAIRRDNSVDCFLLKNHSREQTNKQFFVIMDLETFYDKKDAIIEDLQSVRLSIYEMLNRNQAWHASLLGRVMENRQDMILLPQKVELKRKEYDKYLAQLASLLSTLAMAEKRNITETEQLTDKTLPGLSGDIDRAHRQNILQKELENIKTLQKEISKLAVVIREKKDNIILSTDNIFFDNVILFDRVVKHFAEIKALC